MYGPWGRPDMAVYKFTESIKTGRPLLMFKSTQPLFRDFTFVNDTVGVVLAAMDHTPSCCGEIYNAGRGKPEGLESLVEYLEEEFNTKSVRVCYIVHVCELSVSVCLSVSCYGLSLHCRHKSPSCHVIYT